MAFSANDLIKAAMLGGKGGGGGPSVQPDWAQTDETKPDFIRNKPFGETPVVFFEGTDVTFTEGAAEFASNGAPNIGDTVTVVFDGTTYECEVLDAFGYPGFGNSAAIGLPDDTGEPFFCLHHTDTEAVSYVTDTTKTHSIKVTGILVTKIPLRYIGNEALAKFFIGQQTSTKEYIFHEVGENNKVTKEELLATVRSKVILLTVGDGAYYYPIIVDPYFRDTYGSISYSDGDFKTVYTAEYTPPETT